MTNGAWLWVFRIVGLVSYLVTATVADRDLSQLDVLLRAYLGTGR